MHTLNQLVSGELKGSKILKLSCQLNTFPQQIFDLADTLEILDLSNNNLSQLPSNFSDLKKLKIAFFSENNFTNFPDVFSTCQSLTMIGFKSNKIKFIPENAFPKHLQWLILTNNLIEELPKSIGNCIKLQKVALAGNKLKSLPKEMVNCKNLELLRISANSISQFPDFLFELPRLAWLAFAGNPCHKTSVNLDKLNLMEWDRLTILEQLGEGASGHIYKAIFNDAVNTKEVAVKIFKGEVTSDGYPEDEMNACIAVDNHKNLVNTVAKIQHHPQQKLGLVFEIIPQNYFNLAGPPSFETCTRDTFKAGTVFSLQSILKITSSIADACYHLHVRGIMHGDLYAHNTLIDENANTIFGDFGAASFYNTNKEEASYFERIDVRAFGCLIDDLLMNCDKSEMNHPTFKKLELLKQKCWENDILQRPSFKEIMSYLKE